MVDDFIYEVNASPRRQLNNSFMWERIELMGQLLYYLEA